MLTLRMILVSTYLEALQLKKLTLTAIPFNALNNPSRALKESFGTCSITPSTVTRKSFEDCLSISSTIDRKFFDYRWTVLWQSFFENLFFFFGNPSSETGSRRGQLSRRWLLESDRATTVGSWALEPIEPHVSIWCSTGWLASWLAWVGISRLKATSSRAQTTMSSTGETRRNRRTNKWEVARERTA